MKEVGLPFSETSEEMVCRGRYISMHYVLGEPQRGDGWVGWQIMVDTVAGRCALGLDGKQHIVSTIHIADNPSYSAGNLGCTGTAPSTTPTTALSLKLVAPNETRPSRTGGTSEIAVTAKVTEGTSPKAGVPITFSVEVTSRSGGHLHDDASRPKGTLTPIQGTTDANGEVKVRFSASQVAGTHSLKATCASCANSPATKEIQVKVPDLVDLFSLQLPNAGWDPTGIGGNERHRDNHYLTLDAITRLVEVSRNFNSIWPNAPRLKLNDASLVWGGKFDIAGTWETNPRAHAEHRIGDNIDIRANNAPGAVPANIRAAVFRWLRRTSLPSDNIPPEFVIQSVNALHEGIGTPNEHFHLRLGN